MCIYLQIYKIIDGSYVLEISEAFFHLKFDFHFKIFEAKTHTEKKANFYSENEMKKFSLNEFERH